MEEVVNVPVLALAMLFHAPPSRFQRYRLFRDCPATEFHT
jgi:hypothetical protein